MQFVSVKGNVAKITTVGSQQQFSIDVMSRKKFMIVTVRLHVCVEDCIKTALWLHMGALDLYYASLNRRYSAFVSIIIFKNKQMHY